MQNKFKNTGSLDELIFKTLKTDDDIKEWLTVGFEEFLQNSDLNAFVKVLEYAVKTKDSISNMARKTKIARSSLYSIFKGEQEPQISTVAKILKELGYSIRIA
ncbi:MAG: helix-turn-helix domain-containing protein [Candidatus Gastranaerophilales bacterium]